MSIIYVYSNSKVWYFLIQLFNKLRYPFCCKQSSVRIVESLNLKVLLLISFLMFLSASPAISQDMKKLMADLNNPKKLNKVNGSLNDAFLDNPNDILANYGLSVLATNPALPDRSLFKSWFHIRLSQKNYSSLTSEIDKGAINKALPGALLLITKQFTDIDSSLWIELSAKRDLQFIQSYLYLLSDSKYINKYVALRNNLEFERAKTANTIKAYSDFINFFPRADDMAEAIRLKDKLELMDAQKKDIIFVYNDYVSTHPLSVELPAAIKLRDKKAYDLAVESNDLVEVDFFIYHYPTAPQVDKAITLRSKLAYNIASKQNTLDSYQEYIYHNPNTPFIPIAIAKRDSIVYSEMQQLKSNDAFNEFMSGFPFAITAFNSFLDKYAFVKPKSVMVKEE